jgi:transcriptional antiterminator NusG
MGEKVYWYVLFVRTGSEEKLAKILAILFKNNNIIPFVPRKTMVFRRQGQKSLFTKICFPGYVFLESEIPPVEILKYAFRMLYYLKEVYGFLHYKDRSTIAMRDSERLTLSKMFGKDRCIDMSLGFSDGDAITIVDGPLSGHESRILRINRKRGTVTIEIEMFGNMIEAQVGLEVVKKAS